MQTSDTNEPRPTHASFQRGVVAMRGIFARHIALSIDSALPSGVLRAPAEPGLAIAVYDARRLALRAARARRIAIELGHAARLLGAGT